MIDDPDICKNPAPSTSTLAVLSSLLVDGSLLFRVSMADFDLLQEEPFGTFPGLTDPYWTLLGLTDPYLALQCQCLILNLRTD